MDNARDGSIIPRKRGRQPSGGSPLDPPLNAEKGWIHNLLNTHPWELRGDSLTTVYSLIQTTPENNVIPADFSTERFETAGIFLRQLFVEMIKIFNLIFNLI